ncbi:hypothetical protein THAOC_22748 [Thalassiosira oceanica]|uniref:Uncharacterized protein n=1 Tax=Thalassiosira oceanica TaxID=159749 RepID=K0RTT3_THAOC|nr:hypothetical protein THAOC_22748 [Thalassiosira oceanica]|eukprot:EJK57233.1 hypothetical protein THAOC_22748 [Thalassiosira oceanica]
MKGRSTPALVDRMAVEVSENTRRIEADMLGAAHRDALPDIQALSTKYSTDRLAERGNPGGHIVERGRAIWTHGRDRKATNDAGYASSSGWAPTSFLSTVSPWSNRGHSGNRAFSSRLLGGKVLVLPIAPIAPARKELTS